MVSDWELRPRQSAEDVRRYLEASAIAYQVGEPTPGLTLRFTTEPAGAEIVFDDAGLLDSIGVSLSE